MRFVSKCYFSKLIFIPCWKWTQTEDRCEVVLTLIQDDNKYKHQVNLWGHDTCSLSVIAMDHHPPRPSAPLQPCDHLCGWIPALCCKWKVTFQHLCACSCDDAIPQKKKKKEKRPHAALLVPPTLSFSQFPATPLGSWVLSEKLFFTQPHRCQPIGGLWSRCHVMVCSQSQTPTTAHFLEGKYIHRAWMFLFLISSAGKKKEESKAATFATVP